MTVTKGHIGFQCMCDQAPQVKLLPIRRGEMRGPFTIVSVTKQGQVVLEKEGERFETTGKYIHLLIA